MKIYLDVPKEIETSFLKEGRSLEKVISDNSNFKTTREEIIVGDDRTRGVFTVVLAGIGGFVSWVLYEYGKETLKPIIKDFSEPSTAKLREILKPVYKKLGIKTPEEEKNATEIFYIEGGAVDEKVLIPVELPEDDYEVLELKDDIYVRVRKPKEDTL